MAEDEVFDVGVFLQILLGKEHQVLTIFTQINCVILFLVFDIAVTGPGQPETDAPSWVQA